MSCPTCDHTMINVGKWDTAGLCPLFWCPRCGTIRCHNAEADRAPHLVAYCRNLARDVARADVAVFAREAPLRMMHRTGILQSINLPKERVDVP